MMAMPNHPIARFKDLSIDTLDPVSSGRFWAQVLDRSPHPAPDRIDQLTGPTPGHTVWITAVPEAKQVKNRVHLDIYARSLDEVIALGARVVLAQGDGRGWTVMADPDGSEFCAFLRDELPPERLHGLVVDSAEPATIARWWGRVLGGDITDDHDDDYSTLSAVPGLPIETMDFVPVPEPKTVKNRVHWDVTGVTADLIAAGARLVRARDDEIRWDVLADPEGNEFCAFAP
jgi:hypothetical protein